METDQRTDASVTENLGGRARSLANLRPPWPKGTSGNDRGTTSDGRSTKEPRLQDALRKRLAKPGAMDKLAATWIQAAYDGCAASREQILKRLWPLTDETAQGRVVFEGLRFELPNGVKAEVLRGQLPPGISVETNVAAQRLAAERQDVPQDSDAVPTSQESQWVPSTETLSSSQTLSRESPDNPTQLSGESPV